MEWIYHKEHKMWAEPFHIVGKAYMKCIRGKKWYQEGRYVLRDYEIDQNETEFSLMRFNKTYINGEFIRDVLWDFDIDDRYVAVKIETPSEPFTGPIVIREIDGKKLRIPYLIAEHGREQNDIDTTYYNKVDVESIEPTDLNQKPSTSNNLNNNRSQQEIGRYNK